MQICFNFKQRELYIWLWIDIRSLFIAIEIKRNRSISCIAEEGRGSDQPEHQRNLVPLLQTST
jgi:hypothetical protein